MRILSESESSITIEIDHGVEGDPQRYWDSPRALEVALASVDIGQAWRYQLGAGELTQASDGRVIEVVEVRIAYPYGEWTTTAEGLPVHRRCDAAGRSLCRDPRCALGG